MRGWIAVTWMMVVVSACTGETNQQAARSWTLQADDSMALYDPYCADCGTYPNAYSVDSMLVTLRPDGRLCASAEGRAEWCGGPVQGIPYTTRGRIDGGQLYISVVDIHGKVVARWRSDELDTAALTGEPGEATCRDATASNGQACRICADANGTVTLNTCPTDDSTIDEFGEMGAPDCSTPGGAALLGARTFANAFNGYTSRAGLTFTVDPSAIDVASAHNFDEGDIDLGDPSCLDIFEYQQDEFSDDDPTIGGTDSDDDPFSGEALRDCVEDGRCRIGQLVTRGMAEACRNMPPGCNLTQFTAGVIAGGGDVEDALCEGGDEEAPVDSPKAAIIVGDAGELDCVGSPLVVDLAADGLSLSGTDAGVRFPLMSETARSVGWLAGSDDALLAIDLDADGAITSGRELFGEGTGGWAPDGFAALARADANGDGVIDATDPVFGRLLAWRDDGDGVSEPSELVSLQDTGIVSVPLAARRIGSVDASGNELGLGVTARGSGGRDVPIVDVWFRFGR